MDKESNVPESSNRDEPKKTAKKAFATGKPKRVRTFPLHSIEECRVIADIIKKVNAGNPWAPKDVASALSVGVSNDFFYLTQSSREYQITVGTSKAEKIELTETGRLLVYPKTPQEEYQAIVQAFKSIALFNKG